MGMLLPFQHRKIGIWEWPWGYLSVSESWLQAAALVWMAMTWGRRGHHGARSCHKSCWVPAQLPWSQYGNFLVQTWKANTGQGPGKHLIPGHALWLLAWVSRCWRKPCQGDPSQEDALIRQLSLVMDPRGSTWPLLVPSCLGSRGICQGRQSRCLHAPAAVCQVPLRE